MKSESAKCVARISISAWSKTRVTVWSDNNKSEARINHMTSVFAACNSRNG